MISIHIAGVRFQMRAAAVIVHDGHLLLHRLQGDSFWALPGGRVEPGEDARSTVVREMHEELGEAVECEQLLYVVENFFHYGDQPNHEIGMYFQVQLPPTSERLDTTRVHSGIEGAQRLEFRWFLQSEVPALDLHPSFLREALSRPLPSTPQHVVQRD